MCVSRSDIELMTKRTGEAAPAVEHSAEFARQAYIVVEARWSPSQLKRCASLGHLETCNLSYLTEEIVPNVRKLSEAGVRPARKYSTPVTMMRHFSPHCMCEQDCDCKQVIPKFVRVRVEQFQ